MVQINGRINGTITGICRATPDSPFIDTSTNPPTLVVNPYEATITNSQFTITLPQSQTLQSAEGITYKWELFETKAVVIFYLLDGSLYSGPVHQWATDNKWYTGTTHDSTSRLLDRVSQNQNVPIQDPFHAVAPDSATAVNFTSLVGIPTQSPWFDIGLARIAELLTTVATYRDRISAKFTVRGAYAANTTYSLNDVVTGNGNSYVYRNNTPSQNQAPPLTGDNANWLMIAAKGAAGGTGAQIVGYNATTWAGSAEAAARDDVRAAITSIPNPDVSTLMTKAEGLPRNNAVMTGSSKRDPLTYPVASAERAREIPTAQYIEDALSQFSAPNLSRPIVWARRTTDQIVMASGSSVGSGDIRVSWNNSLLGSANMSNGLFTVPANGNYLFWVSLNLQMQPNSATEPTLSIARAYLSSSAAGELEGFFRYCGRLPYTVPSLFQHGGLVYLSGLTAGTTIEARLNMLFTNNAKQYETFGGVVGSTQNQLLIWRVS